MGVWEQKSWVVVFGRRENSQRVPYEKLKQAKNKPRGAVNRFYATVPPLQSSPCSPKTHTPTPQESLLKVQTPTAPGENF